MSKWKPVENGKLIHASDNAGEILSIDKKLVVTGVNRNGFYHRVMIHMPANIRLCYRAEPDDVEPAGGGE